MTPRARPSRALRHAGARLVRLLLGAVLLAPLALAQGPPERDEIAQAEIRAAVHAASAAEAQEALATLAARVGSDPLALVGQLVHYGLRSTTTRDGMAFGVLREALGIGPAAVLRGTLPFLESAEPAVRAHAAGILEELEDADPERRPTFAPYRPVLDEARRRGEEPPPGLLRHLVTRDPGVALLLFARVWVDDGPSRRPYLWAEHVVADLAWRERHGFPTEAARDAAAGEVSRLAADPRWWARLGAAGFLLERPGLDRGALALLARDEHPLVRELAAAAR